MPHRTRHAMTMRKANRAMVSALALSLGLAANTTAQAPADPVRMVNVFIGSGSGPIGYGGTMPFVTPPFGMTDWTPQTKVGTVSYKYEDTSISGFMGAPTSRQ